MSATAEIARLDAAPGVTPWCRFPHLVGECRPHDQGDVCTVRVFEDECDAAEIPIPCRTREVGGVCLSVKLCGTDPTDPSHWVAGEIRRAIAEGETGPGERLPPTGDLAAVLEVGTTTVLRALRLLRDEGLLEFGRGRGILGGWWPAC